MRKVFGRPLSALVLVAVAAFAAAILAVIALSGSGEEHTALAHISPGNCDTGIGSSGSSLRINAQPAPVVNGSVLDYRVGVVYLAFGSGDPGCTTFDIDVFLDPPGPVGFQLICNIASLPYGSPITECPNGYLYTANSAHRTGSLLVANVVAIGSKHDQPDDCVVPAPRDPLASPDPICFYAQNTSNVSMPNTPTPTTTPIATNTPTATPSHTPTRVVNVRFPWPAGERWYYYCRPHKICGGAAPDFTPLGLDFGVEQPANAVPCPDGTPNPDLAHQVVAVGSGKVVAQPAGGNGQYKIELGTWSGSSAAATFTSGRRIATYYHVYVDPGDLPGVGARLAAGVELGHPSCIPPATHRHVHIEFDDCIGPAANPCSVTAETDPRAGAVLFCGHEVETRNLFHFLYGWFEPWDESEPRSVGCGPPNATSVASPASGVVMPAGTTEFETTVSDGSLFRRIWRIFFEGSSVDVLLVAPDGSTINPSNVGDLGGTYTEGATWRTYEIPNAEPGNWAVQVYGSDVPPEGESVVLYQEECTFEPSGPAGDPCAPDDDNDGCDDSEEDAANPPITGGDRDPLNPYDFYDVNGDALIDLQDTLAILDHFGRSTTHPDYDPLFDRYEPDPSKPWRTAYAGNGIDLVDALVNLDSFGHTCTAAP